MPDLARDMQGDRRWTMGMEVKPHTHTHTHAHSRHRRNAHCTHARTFLWSRAERIGLSFLSHDQYVGASVLLVLDQKPTQSPLFPSLTR